MKIERYLGPMAADWAAVDRLAGLPADLPVCCVCGLDLNWETRLLELHPVYWRLAHHHPSYHYGETFYAVCIPRPGN